VFRDIYANSLTLEPATSDVTFNLYGVNSDNSLLLDIGNNAGNGAFIRFNKSAPSLSLYNTKLGINDPSPNHSLDIIGVDSNLVRIADTQDYAVMTVTGNGLAGTAVLEVGDLSTLSTGVKFKVDVNNELAYFDGGGVVSPFRFGIGDSTPSATLDIKPTSGSDPILLISTWVGGVEGDALTIDDVGNITAMGGVVIGNPTAGNKGAGTISAVQVWDENATLNDYVFDKYYDGKVLPEDEEKHGDFNIVSIEEMGKFAEKNRHLPTIPGRKEWNERRGFSLGELSNYLWRTVEVNSIYIYELHDRVKALENSVLLKNDLDEHHEYYNLRLAKQEERTSKLEHELAIKDRQIQSLQEDVKNLNEKLEKILKTIDANSSTSK
jgi:uncharacterized coiled-coil protein SlyX